MSNLIIVGGGSSIRSFPNLWIDLKGKDVMSVNYAYRFLKEPPKYQISMDKKFWKGNYVDMERLADAGCTIINRNNEMVITREFRSDAFFCGQRRLSGIFAISYATKRLIDYRRIFLLGYDFGPIDGRTHFYDGINHSGVDKIRAYLDMQGNVLPALRDFDYFDKFDISIVGQSHIKSFPIITYGEFLHHLEVK